MKKALWLLILALLLACGPSTADSQPASSETEVESFSAETEDVAESEVEAESEATAVIEENTESTESSETEDAPADAAGSESALPAASNLDSFTPAATVEEAAVIRDQDWLRGAADPIVVIIEYGDFQ